MKLLAKSTKTPDKPQAAETLRGHTAYVFAGAENLLACRGEDALRASGLPLSLFPELARLVKGAAFIHDLGKASEHFQWMVRGEKIRQLIRHEACSLLLGWPSHGPLSQWLLEAFRDELELKMALVIAAGHHRKFYARSVATEDSGAGTKLKLLLSHEDFASTLLFGAAKLGISQPRAYGDYVIENTRRNRIERVFEEAEVEFVGHAFTAERRKLIAIAKALLIAADVAGSALPRSGEKSPRWISETLGKQRDPRGLDAIITNRLGGHRFRDFQIKTSESTAPVTMVKAGCGTGKTIASYLWARKQYPGRRVYECYPTTNTTTEGYRGYIQNIDVRGKLEHSRAQVDVEIFGLDDDNDGRDFDRLEALRSWDKDVITCTVDTVLGLMHHQRKGLYAFPALVRSVIVFDEIHAYDATLFGTLLRFIEEFPGIPVLLMTASMPKDRLELLRRTVERVHGRPLVEIDGPSDIEELPRYYVSKAPAEPSIKRALEENKKVLYISNTVNRCIEASDGLKTHSPIVYHSRFKYIDRVARHGAIMDAFNGPGGVLATTTQTAEMSLDISAQLIVTELAPIYALIQRLGRLNRWMRLKMSPCPFIIVEPENPLPYTLAQLAESRRWLERLGARNLSQRNLVREWYLDPDAIDIQIDDEHKHSSWLDGMFRSEPESTRDAMPTIQVILREDASLVEEQPSQGPRYALPMNTNLTIQNLWGTWPKVAGIYPCPPTDIIDYDPVKGGRWRI